MSEHLLTPFQRTWAMMLHTRKRDGSWIGTPVNVAVDGDRAYFGKPAIAAKVKRLRNFADVAIAPSTPRGTPTGSFVGARARLLRGDEATRHPACCDANTDSCIPYLSRSNSESDERKGCSTN